MHTRSGGSRTGASCCLGDAQVAGCILAGRVPPRHAQLPVFVLAQELVGDRLLHLHGAQRWPAGQRAILAPVSARSAPACASAGPPVRRQTGGCAQDLHGAGQ